MKKQIVSTLMMAVFTLVFLLSAGMLLAYYGEGVRQQQAFRALERITEKTPRPQPYKQSSPQRKKRRRNITP